MKATPRVRLAVYTADRMDVAPTDARYWALAGRLHTLLISLSVEETTEYHRIRRTAPCQPVHAADTLSASPKATIRENTDAPGDA